MRKIKDILHEKRKTTEDHIRQLQREGTQGVRYTAMMPDIPFLILALLSDAGWICILYPALFTFAGTVFVMCWIIWRSLYWPLSYSALSILFI